MSEEKPDNRKTLEMETVFRNREKEAHQAGMCWADASVFAERTDLDIGQLRHLIGVPGYGKQELHCPGELLAKVLL